MDREGRGVPGKKNARTIRVGASPTTPARGPGTPRRRRRRLPFSLWQPCTAAGAAGPPSLVQVLAAYEADLAIGRTGRSNTTEPHSHKLIPRNLATPTCSAKENFPPITVPPGKHPGPVCNRSPTRPSPPYPKLDATKDNPVEVRDRDPAKASPVDRHLPATRPYWGVEKREYDVTDVVFMKRSMPDLNRCAFVDEYLRISGRDTSRIIECHGLAVQKISVFDEMPLHMSMVYEAVDGHKEIEMNFATEAQGGPGSLEDLCSHLESWQAIISKAKVKRCKARSAAASSPKYQPTTNQLPQANLHINTVSPSIDTTHNATTPTHNQPAPPNKRAQ
ncbi:hypothetical protein Pelo_2507 [Pelomyxa schiedti]|nr:hypothetical protein Pelo_2507 [Pelomyxa schiedti]